MIKCTKRQKIIVKLCNEHIFKDLAELTSNYDYHIKGKSRILNSNKSVTFAKLFSDGFVLCGINHNKLEIWHPDTGLYNCLNNNNDYHYSNVTITQKGKIFCRTSEHIISWDPKTNIRINIFSQYISAPILSFIVEISDHLIAVGELCHNIKIINTYTGNVERILNHTGAYICEVLPNVLMTKSNSLESKSTDRIVSVCGYSLKIWNIISGECEFNCTSQYWITCIKILADMRIVCGLSFGKIIILDPSQVISHESQPEKNSCNYVLDAIFLGCHLEGINKLLLLSNGLLISASDDNTLKVWDLDKKIKIMTLEDHTGPITCVAELPDQRIISGSRDHTLKIWNLVTVDSLPTKRCDITLYESAEVSCIVILPNGKILSGTSGYPDDGTARQFADNGTLKIWS